MKDRLHPAVCQATRREPHLPNAVTCTAVAHAAEAGSVSGRLPAASLSDASLSSMASVMHSAAATPCVLGRHQRCAEKAWMSITALRVGGGWLGRGCSTGARAGAGGGGGGRGQISCHRRS